MGVSFLSDLRDRHALPCEVSSLYFSVGNFHLLGILCLSAYQMGFDSSNFSCCGTSYQNFMEIPSYDLRVGRLEFGVHTVKFPAQGLVGLLTLGAYIERRENKSDLSSLYFRGLLVSVGLSSQLSHCLPARVLVTPRLPFSGPYAQALHIQNH